MKKNIKKAKLGGVRCAYFSLDQESANEFIKKYPPIAVIQKDTPKDMCVGYCNFSHVDKIIYALRDLPKNSEWKVLCTHELGTLEVGTTKNGKTELRDLNDFYATLKHTKDGYVVTQLKPQNVLYSGPSALEALVIWSKALRKTSNFDEEGCNKLLNDDDDKNSNIKVSIRVGRGDDKEWFEHIRSGHQKPAPIKQPAKPKTELELLLEMPVIDIQKNPKVYDLMFVKNKNFEKINSREKIV